MAADLSPFVQTQRDLIAKWMRAHVLSHARPLVTRCRMASESHAILSYDMPRGSLPMPVLVVENGLVHAPSCVFALDYVMPLEAANEARVDISFFACAPSAYSPSQRERARAWQQQRVDYVSNTSFESAAQRDATIRDFRARQMTIAKRFAPLSNVVHGLAAGVIAVHSGQASVNDVQVARVLNHLALTARTHLMKTEGVMDAYEADSAHMTRIRLTVTLWPQIAHDALRRFLLADPLSVESVALDFSARAVDIVVLPQELQRFFIWTERLPTVPAPSRLPFFLGGANRGVAPPSVPPPPLLRVSGPMLITSLVAAAAATAVPTRAFVPTHSHTAPAAPAAASSSSSSSNTSKKHALEEAAAAEPNAKRKAPSAVRSLFQRQ
jgi:hypothetical protein